MSLGTIKIRGKTCKQWTVSELKSALKKKKLPVSGPKLVLCERLKDSYKQKVPKSSSVKPKTSKNQPETINTQSSEFKFYASMYYQKSKRSQIALKYFVSHGLTKSFVDSFDSHQDLSVYIQAYQNTLQ